MDSFDRSFGFFKFIFITAFIFIIGMFVFRIGMVYKSHTSGKVLYEISVNTFNEVQVYLTSNYVRDKETGCISFKDEFGIKRVVCNNYTITEY